MTLPVDTHGDAAILRVSLDTLVAEHGRWRVVAATLKAMVRGHKRAQAIRGQDLSNWIRADIGLPAAADPPGPAMPVTMRL